MKFCPECGVKLIGQKFCHECGCNISKFKSNLGGSDDFGVSSVSTPIESGSVGFGSFDFSSLENAAKNQLTAQKEIESFYKNAEVNGTTLVKYNGSDENVVIPSGITEIKNSAFYSSKVKSIKIPETVSKIEVVGIYCSSVESFEVDPGNRYFKSIDGVVYTADGRTLVQFPNGRSGYYTMPGEVENVRRSAISGCVKLSGLTLSNRLTRIDDFMFCGTAFSTLNIPSSVTCIGTI